MSRYVPPHRKQTDDNNTPLEGEVLQREAWQALSRSITGIINKVSGDNIAVSATELFRENILRGRGLLCRSLMRAQLADPDLTDVFAALVGCVNKEFSAIGVLLARRLVVQWKRVYRRRDWRTLRSINKFIGWLYNFNIVGVDVIYQIIIAHLTSESRTDDDVDQATALFRETFRAMSSRCVADFHEYVLTPIRDLLAMDSDEWRLSPRAQALLEGCLKEIQQWERVKHEVSFIPEHLSVVDPSEQQCHDVDLDEPYDAEEKLDRFAYDAEYEAHEAAYETARRAILGNDWEKELLEAVAAADDDDDDNEAEEEEEDKRDNGNRSQANLPGSLGDSIDKSQTNQPIDEEERRVRREVYMAMRSSVRADEVVHKVLKTMSPGTERTICFMVIEGCCEEAAFKKTYAMVAERLCKSNAKFQNFFAEAFCVRYKSAEDLTEKQIEFTSKVYTHLLRTGSLQWHRCVGVLDIVHNDVSQRLMIQWLLHGLVEAMGMRSVRERFEQDRELRASATKLFPAAPPEAMEHAVNMFEAMGLGELATTMRGRLEEQRRTMKRPRDDDLRYV